MFDIRSLTWDEWSYPEGVILPIVTLGTIRPEDSGAARNATSFIIKLYSETQVSGRLGLSGGISPRHAQNPLSGERRKTLSITHHALSPPPSHHHLYIIHLIKGGGMGVTSAWSPLGNFIEGQAHPSVLLILCFSHVITYGSRVFCITFQSILNRFGGKYRA